MRSSISSATMAFAVFSYTTSSNLASAFQYSANAASATPAAAAASSSCSSSSFFFTSTSSTQLDAAASSSSNNNFSELNNLRAKRLSLTRRRPQPSSSSPIDDHPIGAIHTQQQQQQGLEYLYDQTQERHDDDFFHVILMPSTFSNKQVSIEQVANSLLTTTLSFSSSTSTNNDNAQLTYEKAHNLSLFAKHQGFSLIGTWTRDHCLLLGEKLVMEGLDCRVIPYSEGLVMTSQQSKPSSSSSSSSLVMSEESSDQETSLNSSSSSSSDYLLSLSH